MAICNRLTPSKSPKQFMHNSHNASCTPSKHAQIKRFWHCTNTTFVRKCILSGWAVDRTCTEVNRAWHRKGAANTLATAHHLQQNNVTSAGIGGSFHTLHMEVQW